MAIPFPHPNSVAAGWLTPPKNRPWDSAASWCLGKSTFQAAKEWLSLGETFDKKGNNLGYTGLGWGKRLQSKKSFSFDQLINLCCQLLALGANHWGRPAGWVLPYGLICCCLYRGYMNQTSYVVGVQTSYDCKTCWWVVTKMFNRPSFLGWWSQAAWHCFCCCCCRRLLFLSQKNIITKMPCFMCFLIGLF